MQKVSLNILAQVVGSVAVVAGSFVHFLEFPSGKFIFAAGALTVIVLQLIILIKSPAQGFREQRLQRMNFMVSLVLALAVYSMVEGTTLWVPAVLIYALVTLFLSFRS